MRYEWTDYAKEGRDQIADYIYERFGEKRSMKFLDDVDEAVGMILHHPALVPSTRCLPTAPSPTAVLLWTD